MDANGVHTAMGAEPENALTGQLFGPDGTGEPGGALDIPASFAGLRVWRDTSVAATGELDIAPGILGYEWDTSPEDQISSGRPDQALRDQPFPGAPFWSTRATRCSRDRYRQPFALSRRRENALVFGAGNGVLELGV